MMDKIEILVVDDEYHITKSITEFLKVQGFTVYEAYNGKEALKIWNRLHPPFILTDIDMPGMNGIDLLKHIKANKRTQVVMFSGAGAMNDIVESLRFGACDYLMKPINFDLLLHSINKCIERYLFLVKNDKYQEDLEREVKKKTADLRNLLDEMVRSLSMVTEIRDPYTAGHQRRATRLSLIFAKELHYKDTICLEYAGLLHDIGKIRVPAAILTKPTKLTDSEFSLIKEHAEAGYSIIKNVPFENVLGSDVAEIVYQHHERLDGSGYPRQLRGNEILKESKILAICDTVEAMASHRPYRPALGLKAALNEIQRGMKTIYDYEISELCLDILKPFQNHSLDEYLNEIN